MVILLQIKSNILQTPRLINALIKTRCFVRIALTKKLIKRLDTHGINRRHY